MTVKTRAEVHKDLTNTSINTNTNLSRNAESMLEESGDYLQSTHRSTIYPTINPSGELPVKDAKANPLKVNQIIDVTIGISQQVVENHCNGSSEERIIVSATKRCALVERLAKRDLELVNEYYIDTGKKYEFKSFDTPWDQTSPQKGNCGKTRSEQYLPPGECIRDNSGKKIYITILHVDGAITSGGEAPGSVVRYVAPYMTMDGFGSIYDYWERGQGIISGGSDSILAHEIGHTLGQTHYFFLDKRENKIAPFSYDFTENDIFNKTVYFYDLYRYQQGWKLFDWPLQIAQRCTYSSLSPTYDGPCSTNNYIPKRLVIKLSLLNHNNEVENYLVQGKFVIFSSKLDYFHTTITGEDKLMEGTILDNGIELFNTAQTLKNKSLLFILLKIDNELYYGWVHISEWNMAYFNNADTLSIFLKKVYDIQLANELRNKYFQSLDTR